MYRLMLISIAALTVLAIPASGARFTDTFSTDPAQRDRKPFWWDGFPFAMEPDRGWNIVDGVLEYKTENTVGRGGSVSCRSAGIAITDDTDWSLEVGFRHVAGTASRPAYEAIAYVTWFSEQPGQMRIVAMMYDAENRAIVLRNGGAEEKPIPVDLSGRFHPVRLTAGDGQLRVYVDGQLAGGPVALGAQPYYQEPGFYIGPITSGDAHTLHFQFNYFAFTNAGAIDPHEQPGWTPAADIQPVAEELRFKPIFSPQPAYPGITLLRREKGSAQWDKIIPDHWRKLRTIIAGEPSQIVRPFYLYKGETAPAKQNIYRNYQALKYDENRCVAVSHLTRGTDDTGPGFMDYKLWYRVSTDGGRTYDEERPLVQSGDEHSPMHPIKYVWVGKNSFCYAAIPPFLRMSNGEILLPIYFAPLDEQGTYYNPLGAFTFTFAAALIGRWNEAGNDVEWEVSQDIRLDGDQSSRGSNECAVVELSREGRIFMVMRGSNAPNPKGNLPAVKWKTLSTDYGRTWSKCEHFTYSDGEGFLSPSSCSSFIRSSRTKKIYWIGNISGVMPRGNSPRYPLIIAELDEQSLGLRRETVTIIDDRAADDPPEVQFSNFSLIEDPDTRHIVLLMDRYVAAGHRALPGAGVHTYVIEIK